MKSWVRVFCILLIWTLPISAAESVCRVKYQSSGATSEIAERARRFGNEMYPRVCSLLADGTTRLPDRFDIVFLKSVPNKADDDFDEIVGYVRGRHGTTVYLNWAQLSRKLDDLEPRLLHEMAHVAQRYVAAVPNYWREGMADYVCCKLGYACPECSNTSWHYRNGYACTAAFLLFIEHRAGTNFISDLNASLRHKRYSDEFFRTNTGLSIGELWTDFKKTAAFTPGAARANQFFESMGYVEGCPPKSLDLRSRLRKQRGGEITLEAQKFLVRLANEQALPGLVSTAHDWVLSPVNVSDLPKREAYPVSRSFELRIAGGHVLHFEVVKASRSAEWKVNGFGEDPPED